MFLVSTTERESTVAFHGSEESGSKRISNVRGCCRIRTEQHTFNRCKQEGEDFCYALTQQLRLIKLLSVTLPPSTASGPAAE